MEEIKASQRILSRIRQREFRIWKMGNDLYEMNRDMPPENNNDVNCKSVENSGESESGSSRKRSKSIQKQKLTFPTLIDHKHPHRRILMAVKTKPFLIMTGICGTGKSRFSRTLAYQTCPKHLQENGQPGNFQIIAVQSDWHDSDGIIGWRNSHGIYQFTPFIHFLVKAWKYPNVPFILCLDEMNLAKVEMYFADFLSIIESRHWVKGELTSDAFIPASQFRYCSDVDSGLWAKVGIKLDEGLQQRFLAKGLTLPPNLIVIGTANMDEAGNRFSMKVLDRASIIEMPDVDFYNGIKSNDADLKFPDDPIAMDQILGSMLYGREAYELFPKNGDLIITELRALDRLLVESPFRFGYRFRDTALIYCTYNLNLPGSVNDKESVYKYLDEVLLMKMLPRISGFKVNEKLIDNLLSFTKNKYPHCFKRLTQMKNTANEFTGFSFW